MTCAVEKWRLKLKNSPLRSVIRKATEKHPVCVLYKVIVLCFWYDPLFHDSERKVDRVVVSGQVVSRPVVSLTFDLLDTWTFGHLIFGTNELLDMWSCRLLAFLTFGLQIFDLFDFWFAWHLSSWLLAFWTFRLLDIWSFGHLIFWTFGLLDIWSFGHLVF